MLLMLHQRRKMGKIECRITLIITHETMTIENLTMGIDITIISINIVIKVPQGKIIGFKRTLKEIGDGTPILTAIEVHTSTILIFIEVAPTMRMYHIGGNVHVGMDDHGEPAPIIGASRHIGTTMVSTIITKAVTMDHLAIVITM